MIPGKKRKALFFAVIGVVLIVSVPSSYVLYSGTTPGLNVSSQTGYDNFTGDFTNTTSTYNPLFCPNAFSITTIAQKGYNASTLQLSLYSGHGYNDPAGNRNLSRGSGVVFIMLAVNGTFYGKLNPSDLNITLGLVNPSSNLFALASYGPYVPDTNPVNMSAYVSGPRLNAYYFKNYSNFPISATIQFLNHSNITNPNGNIPYHFSTSGELDLTFGLIYNTPYHFVLRAQLGGSYSSINSTLFFNIENT